MVKEFRSISSQKLDWQIITPNEKADWINQRDGMFDSLIPIGDKKYKNNTQTFFVPYYSSGLKTNRDAWCYNSSLYIVRIKAQEQIEYYNERLERQENIDYGTTKLSWTTAVINDFRKRKNIVFPSANTVKQYIGHSLSNNYYIIVH